MLEVSATGAAPWSKLNSSAKAVGVEATPPTTTKLANDAMANKRFLNMGKYFTKTAFLNSMKSVSRYISVKTAVALW